MKKLVTIATMMMAAMLVKADTFLYWTVAENAWNGAQYAALMGTTSEGGDYMQIGSKVAVGAAADTLIADSSAYTSFMVNLFTYSEANGWQGVATTCMAYTLAALNAYTYQDLGVMSQRPSTPYSFSGFVVPEPTSGMMILLGVAALALKRRIR